MSNTDTKQLEEIKRLLMLLLMKLDSTSDELALALGVDSSVVRRAMPAGKIRKIIKKSNS